MNVGFVGLGKLGLPCALAVEAAGHKVFGFDPSKDVAEIIAKKKIPYREVHAQELLTMSDLTFCSDLVDLVRESEIIFVAIQTPHQPMYEGTTRIPYSREDFDYSMLASGISDLSKAVAAGGEDKGVVIISTVLPGTVDEIIRPLLTPHVKLCYNPFFIAMGTTIDDFRNPEFVLFGVDDIPTAEKAKALYATIHEQPFFETTIKNAELIKVAYNTYIGQKIIFANAMMEICEKTGADVDAVTDALSLADQRLMGPKYLRGGMGDGGGCHPRDNIALSWLARKLDLSTDWFESIMLAREAQTTWLAKMAMELHGDLPIMILGKAFKKETNLEVGSPAILLKNIFAEAGVEVEMYDPHIDPLMPIKAIPRCYVIGTNHDTFKKWNFIEGDVVIDPWRMIPDKDGVHVIRLGEGEK